MLAESFVLQSTTQKYEDLRYMELWFCLLLYVGVELVSHIEGRT